MIYGRTPKCPVCGREPIGLSVFCWTEWPCSDHAKDKEDPIFCEKGCKVEFAYPERGLERERDDAKEILAEGTVYEVERVAVDRYSTEIELKEFPGKKFNSVFFRRVQ